MKRIKRAVSFAMIFTLVFVVFPKAGPATDDGAGNLEEFLGEGSFGSAPVRFRIPNQPLAPVTSYPRMQLTQCRNGAPAFISRTNRNMRVLLGNDAEGNQIWMPLSPNITAQALLDLFENADRPLPTPGDNYEFEFRFFRNNRVVSAPGFFTVPAQTLRNSTLLNIATSPTTDTNSSAKYDDMPVYEYKEASTYTYEKAPATEPEEEPIPKLTC